MLTSTSIKSINHTLVRFSELKAPLYAVQQAESTDENLKATASRLFADMQIQQIALAGFLAECCKTAGNCSNFFWPIRWHRRRKCEKVATGLIDMAESSITAGKQFLLAYEK
jgi:hypothetical protein